MAKGNFIEYVVSDNPNKYPNDGEQGNYYYEVFDGSGAYAWKKYEWFPEKLEEYTNPTLKLTIIDTESGAGKLRVSSDDFDPKFATLDFLLGFEGSSGYPKFASNGYLYIKSGFATKDYTYDSGVISSSLSFSSDYPVGTEWGLSYAGTKSLLTPEHTGDFINFVVSDDPTTYPDGGEQGGYWYELYGLPIKIATWANGTDEEIVKMVEAADQGLINLSDYWSVGDTRTVQLSAMSATGVDESHAAQQVDLVLMHAGGYDLNAAVASGRTKCSFVVGLKDSLAKGGYMNSSDTNSGSWNGSARRAWCNNVFRNAIPSTLRAIFKQFKTVTAQTYNGSTNQTSVDYFALPAEREIFDARNYCNQTEFNALFQFDYYKTTSNRVKKLGKTGTASRWWERSPDCSGSAYFCRVGSDGTTDGSSASISYGLAPFGCI